MRCKRILNTPSLQTRTSLRDNYKPIVGVKVMHGFTKKLDVGLSADMLTNVGINSKYQFLGNRTSKFAGSIGIEGGVNFILFALTGSIANYLSIPLCLSYHPINWCSIYLTPRYSIASVLGTSFSSMPADDEAKFGLTNSFGMLFGKKHQLALEITSYGNYFVIPKQFSIGYVFKFH